MPCPVIKALLSSALAGCISLGIAASQQNSSSAKVQTSSHSGPTRHRDADFRARVRLIISEFEDQDRRLDALENQPPGPNWSVEGQAHQVTTVCESIRRTIGEVTEIGPVPSSYRPTYSLLQEYGKESKGLVYDFEQGSKGEEDVNLLESGLTAMRERRHVMARLKHSLTK